MGNTCKQYILQSGFQNISTVPIGRGIRGLNTDLLMPYCKPIPLFKCNTSACIDGVVNKIDPETEGFGPIRKTCDMSDKNRDKLSFLPRNLDEALDALELDNEFLKRGGVFTDQLIKQWMKIKHEEISAIGTMPHPFEFKMYFNL